MKSQPLSRPLHQWTTLSIKLHFSLGANNLSMDLVFGNFNCVCSYFWDSWHEVGHCSLHVRSDLRLSWDKIHNCQYFHRLMGWESLCRECNTYSYWLSCVPPTGVVCVPQRTVMCTAMRSANWRWSWRRRGQGTFKSWKQRMTMWVSSQSIGGGEGCFTLLSSVFR